ncbi:adenylosuccinate synthetase [Agrobacterium rubi]|nr:adenylosuccinate synthetase [Agrobacterium rubi]NTF24653.1 adenylosuccinate synthetase [Agrobacterium rubi]
MKSVSAVIGSGYGDEGKGLFTDYLAGRGEAPAVVRTNGGAQAGHTVQTPDGRRHVFHHISSGALAGAATHLSQFFVSNPVFFMRERQTIRELSGNASVTVDPRSIITTPYDMMINQVIEKARGSARHGSCGMGFGEAIERSLRPDYALTFGDLASGADRIKAVVDRVRREWAPFRLSQLGFEEQALQYAEMLESEDLVQGFIADCAAYWNSSALLDDTDIPHLAIFEGAQGLLLDQDYGAFPHVTRSNTGLRNMLAVAREAGIGRIDVTYMTRAYATRHGAGPFAYENADTSWLDMVDPTNEPNDWQGTIRTAPLDLDGVVAAIRHDLGHVTSDIEVLAGIGISCVDQVADQMKIGVDGQVADIRRSTLAATVSEAAGLPVSHMSFGPTRRDLMDLN